MTSLEGYGSLFRQALLQIRIAVPEKTPLYSTAEEVLEMAVAYRGDGMTFLQSGDPVNALASFAYGLGWLDTGSSLGLLAPLVVHPPGEFGVCIPDTEADHLHEKTYRYQKMLLSALSMVESGPDESSPMHKSSGDLCATARSWYAGGVECLKTDRVEDLSDALARFSYGYAWLDSGIRAGMLRVIGERWLFTV